ncbi:MAG: MFS transporter [Erysipelotrichaceae bacterium]
MKSQLNKLIFAYAILMLGANMIHPITPTIMSNLSVPDYLFGYSFAAMSLASFLLSPLWGKLSDLYGRKRILTIGVLGYIVGQWLFAFADGAFAVVFARIFAGLFVGGFVVSALSMVSSENRGNTARNMTMFTTITALTGTFGYFLGGMVGVVSIPLTFALQTVFLVLALLVMLTLKEQKRPKTTISKQELRRALNPFSTFKTNRHLLTRGLIVMLVCAFLLNTGIVLYDNSFNYYLKDVLQLSSAYNGMIKGIVGVGSLILNATLVLWLIRKFDLRKVLMGIVLVSAMVLATSLLPNGVVYFLGMNVLFLLAYSASVPLQQAAIAEHAPEEDSGVIFGMLNSLRSMGGVIGALFAGSLYAMDALFPFIGAVILYIIAVGMLWKGK